MLFKMAPSVISIFLLLFSSAPIFAQELIFQMSSEPTQYDPLMLEDGTSLRIAANTIGTLYEYDGEGKLQKSLVDEVKSSKDFKKFTITFKKGLKWSDGETFQVKHFLMALERMSTEKVKPALSFLFPQFDLDKTRVVDDQTLELVLKTADAQFLNWLTLPPFAPIRSDIIEKYRKRPSPVVPTLAAYEVKEHRREDYLKLRANPHYFDRSKLSIPEVKIRFIKDDASLVTLMKQGRVDVLSRVPVLQIAQIQKVAQVVDVPVQAVTYLGLNTKRPPFSSRQNRIAFARSLSDQTTELAALLKTGESPALSFLPMGSYFSKGFKSILASPDPTNLALEFVAQSDQGQRNQQILEWVQAQVKKDLNWKMKIDIMEWKAHYARIKSDAPQVFRFGWQNPVQSLYVFYQVLKSDSPNNFTGWSNVEYDRLVDELRDELDSSQQLQTVMKIEKMIQLEAPVIPLLHQNLRFAISKRVIGFRANPFGVTLFRELRLAQK